MMNIKMMWSTVLVLVITAANIPDVQCRPAGCRRAHNSYSYNPPSGLSVDFYKESCPNAENIIVDKVAALLRNDTGQAAGILRIMAHDCFVQGCDASVLLVKATSEQTAISNNGSLRVTSIRALDEIKQALEEACPATVSCADTIVLSAAAAVRMSGGPRIKFATGRRDSLNAAPDQIVAKSIPAPTYSISALKKTFQNHGLDAKDLVALSGAHTFGQAHCHFVNLQLSPKFSSDLNPKFAANLTRICPPQQINNPIFQRETVHLDFITMNQFDNAYFRNVLAKTATFHSDAELLNAPDTRWLVEDYAKNQDHFFQQFVTSMIKMSQIGVLTRNQGTIRRKCTLPN